MEYLFGFAKMPGTCGELVQGTMDGIPFHVSCPIDLYSRVEVRLQPGGQLVVPAGLAKAGQAVRATLETLGHPRLGGALSVHSPLPRSKGMASSTADVAAAIVATAHALDASIEPRQVADIALGVEPTDGSIFPGIALFDHRSGKLCESLGPTPPIDVIVLDFGGEVDTVAFNSEDHSGLRRQLEPKTNEALALVRAGIALGDPVLVGRGATISALANQHILYKPQLDSVIAMANEVGAVGIGVGHSGTVIGVLLDGRTGDAETAHSFLRRRLWGLDYSIACSVVGGGAEDGRKADVGGDGKRASRSSHRNFR